MGLRDLVVEFVVIEDRPRRGQWLLRFERDGKKDFRAVEAVEGKNPTASQLIKACVGLDLSISEILEIPISEPYLAH